jgi:hypothetical protein
MNSGEDKKPASQPLSEKKRSEFHLYGKPHHEKNLLGQQFEVILTSLKVASPN